jgi:hypothetical protein
MSQRLVTRSRSAPHATDCDRSRETPVFVGVSDAMVGKYGDAISQLIIVLNTDKHPWPEDIRRYLPMLTDLAAAKSPSDVQAAIQAGAAPLGTWRRKTHERMFSIVAYPGVQGGGEVAVSASPTQSVASAPLLPPAAAGGLFAPIGIEYTYPIGDSGYSGGFFLSILDVGALTWTRIQQTANGSTSPNTQPEVSFAQVLSPGLYYRMGLFNSPFVAGVGASYAPSLRKYTFDDASGQSQQGISSFIRVGAFLAVDVTLFPL